MGDKAGTLTLSIPEGTRMDPPKQTLQETLQATKRTLTGFRVQNGFEFKVPLNPDIQDHKVVKVHVPLYIYIYFGASVAMYIYIYLIYIHIYIYI